MVKLFNTKKSKKRVSLINLLLTLVLISGTVLVAPPVAVHAASVAYPQFLMNVSVCSEETVNEGGRLKEYAIDGNTGTFWHTSWGTPNDNTAHANNTSAYGNKSGVANGHWLQVDLGGTYTVTQISYMPRQDGNLNGVVRGVYVYVSSNGSSYTEIGATASTTSWANDATTKTLACTATAGRYVLLLARNPTAYINCAEFNVMVEDEGQSEIWSYAQAAMNQVKAVTIGTTVGTYPQAAQTACIAALTAQCYSAEPVTAVKAAIDTILADFLDNPYHYSLTDIDELLSRCDLLLSSLVVGDQDDNVSQSAYDTFAAALTAAHLVLDVAGAPSITKDNAYTALAAAEVVVRNSRVVATPVLTDGVIPGTFTLAQNIDPDAIRFNNLEWSGAVSVATGLPNQGRQSQVFEVNRVKPHAETIVYETSAKAITGARDYDRESSKYFMSLTNPNDLDPLTSDWKFSIVDSLTTTLATANTTKDPLNPTSNIVDFYKDSYDISNWPGVAVPSSLEVQGLKNGVPYTGYYDPEYGYTPPYYTNISMPGSVTFRGPSRAIFNNISIPGAPNVYNPVGFYRRSFDVPTSWITEKNKVSITFQGVEAAYYVYLNGKEVGYFEDSKMSCEFDITPFLTTDGKNNQLAVKVFRWADASWMDDQDFIRLSGIHRGVFLSATPAVHISDYKVETKFDATYTNATLSLSANVANYTSDFDFSNYRLLAQLFDTNGVDILDGQSIRLDLPGLTANKAITVSGSTLVLNPLQWFPDDPNLYTLVLSLYDNVTKTAVERVSAQVGFREVLYRNEDQRMQVLRINGKKITMRGVNRHDTTPFGGRYVPKDTYLTDVYIMKRNNINTVRTSHYPNDEYFYYLCDKYGVMMIAEANNECHANSNSSISSNNFLDMANSRVLNMVETYKNRASIIMWSLQNETGTQAGWTTIGANLRGVDRTRPVHCEPFKTINQTVGTDTNFDVYSNMYPTQSSIRSTANSSSGISVMPCEYAHAMGNAIGSLNEYMNVFRETQYAVGGCIWDYVNQNIWTLPAPVQTIPESGPYAIAGYMNGNIVSNAITPTSVVTYPNTAGADDGDIFNEKLAGNQPFSVELFANQISTPTSGTYIAKGTDQFSLSFSSDAPATFYPGRIAGDLMRLNPTVTTSTNTSGASEGPDNVKDNSPRTKWCNTTATWPSTVYLRYQFDTAQVARMFMLSSANDDMSYTRSPRDVRIQGSNNGSTWTTLATVTGIVFTNNYQDRVFAFPNETAYTYYRLVLDSTTNGTSGTFQIGDFSLGTGVGAQVDFPTTYNPTLNFTVNGNLGAITASAVVGNSFLGSDQRIVGVYDCENVELWVNGALLTSVPVPEGFIVNAVTDDLAVGQYTGSGYVATSCIANISGARIFSYALENEELIDNSRKANDPASGSGVLFWADYSKPSVLASAPMNDVHGNGMYLGFGGDWGEGNQDNLFCANGMLSATREEEPEVKEVKKVYQNLVFTATNTNLNNGIVNVRNEYYAKNVNDFDIVWTLYEDDEVLDSGTLASVPSIPPMTNQLILTNIPSVALNIPYLSSLPATAKPGAEYFLTVQACLKENEDWAEKGYPLNEEQFKLNFTTTDLPLLYTEDFGKVNVSQDNVLYNISGKNAGKDFTVSFNSATGVLTNYTADGVTLISAGPQPTFFRALMNNDRSGSATWLNTDTTKTLGSFTVTPAANQKSVTINVTYNLTITTSSFIDMTYVVFGNGAVRVTTALRTNNTAQLYRFGVDLTMPAGFENIDWYTRGPVENLNDRTTGSNVGRYQTTVTENFWPYVKPQDTGTRQQTRYMALTSDSKDVGLMVVSTGSRLFEANALHYTWRDMNGGSDWLSTGVMHPYQMKARAETVVSVSYGSRGTGNESCMTVPPLTAFLLPAGNYTYSYTLIPFDKADQDDLTDVSRYYRDAASIKDYREYGLIAGKTAGDLIEATFYNITAAAKSADIILAVYNADGRLVYAETKTVSANALGNAVVTFDKDVSDYEGYTYKVFAWTPDTYAPICENADGAL